MQLLTGPIYLSVLTEAIRKAEKSIVLATMVFDAEPPMDEVIDTLRAARKRGVSVSLYLDAFTKFIFREGMNPGTNIAIQRHLRPALSRLEHAGVRIFWIGTLSGNPYSHRFHQKFSIIDNNIVFFGGGINLNGEGFQVHDYMVQTRNSNLARVLADDIKTIAQQQNVADHRYEIDMRTSLLLDGGQPGRSLIYDTVIELARKAQSITFISQMAPSGKLATILQEKEVRYYFNKPKAMKLPASLSERLIQHKYKYNNLHHQQTYIHAKCMIFSMPGGRKIVLTGSHNFNQRGVDYGTKEIALLTKDESLLQQIEAFVQQLN